MKNDLQAASIENVKRSKKCSCEYLRKPTPTEKNAKLVELQKQYYEMMKLRE